VIVPSGAAAITGRYDGGIPSTSAVRCVTTLTFLPS
jgi:hypothetical protein